MPMIIVRIGLVDLMRAVVLMELPRAIRSLEGMPFATYKPKHR